MQIRRLVLVPFALLTLALSGCASGGDPSTDPSSIATASLGPTATRAVEGTTPAPVAGELGADAGAFRLGALTLRNALIADLQVLCDTPGADTPSAGFVSLHCDREHKDGLMDIWMSSDEAGAAADVTVRFGPYPYPEHQAADIAQVIAYLVPSAVLPSLEALIATPGQAETDGLRLSVEHRGDDVVIRVTDSAHGDFPDPST